MDFHLWNSNGKQKYMETKTNVCQQVATFEVELLEQTDKSKIKISVT